MFAARRAVLRQASALLSTSRVSSLNIPYYARPMTRIALRLTPPASPPRYASPFSSSTQLSAESEQSNMASEAEQESAVAEQRFSEDPLPDDMKASEKKSAQPDYRHTDATGDLLPPSPAVYIGNLDYRLREDSLNDEFSRFGEIEKSKIILDHNGLSKGFGYIVFKDIESAKKAVEDMQGQLHQDRRLTVQFLAPRSRLIQNPHYAEGGTKSPSKTLFLGNMSFDVQDEDLNELFRGVEGVTDVRVAVDRKTGLPRGFAHADFVSISHAERAYAQLKGVQIYGRELRLDYSQPSPERDAKRPARIQWPDGRVAK